MKEPFSSGYCLPAMNKQIPSLPSTQSETSLTTLASSETPINASTILLPSLIKLSSSVLGPSRSDLLPVLHKFTYLRYIYLSEPHEYVQHASRVRGVFPTIGQLLPQLTRDVRMAQQTDSHLIFPSTGRSIQVSSIDHRSSDLDG